MRIVPYLMFPGNCEEAFEFYKSILGGEIYYMRYSEAQGMEVSEGYKNKVLHGALVFDGNSLYGSDGFEGAPVTKGDNCSVTIEPDSEDEIARIFNALKEGGEVKMDLQDTFWGAKFASLDDKYGIHWSLNYTKPEK